MAVKPACCGKKQDPIQEACLRSCGGGIHPGVWDGRNTHQTWPKNVYRKKEFEMSDAATVPPILNKTMKFVLRSPLHRVVSNYLTLITFTGSKSGKTYTTPVSYHQKDDLVFIFTHANWWINLQGGATVRLRLRGKDYPGLAEPIVEDKGAIAAMLTAHLKQSAFDAKFYGVTYDEQGDPIQDEVEQAVQTVVMIRVQLD
jgi:hypothetical protein